MSFIEQLNLDTINIPEGADFLQAAVDLSDVDPLPLNPNPNLLDMSISNHYGSTQPFLNAVEPPSHELHLAEQPPISILPLEITITSVPKHVWAPTPNLTTIETLSPFIVQTSVDDVKSFSCAYGGCKHPVGFIKKAQLVNHIRSTHLGEKPFVCTTCHKSFTRKQDAVRHVDAMNCGRQYKCSGCPEAFSRKDYRDSHEERCLSKM